MRWLLFASICIFISCKKDNHAAGIPDGTWVNKAYLLDTIVTYRENGRNILFDNSALYRSSSSRLLTIDYYKWKYKLESGKIKIKNYPQSAEEYYPYDFAWITEDQEFSITANAIRPYLSSTGGKLVYRKAK